jgi:hypothetical protein
VHRQVGRYDTTYGNLEVNARTTEFKEFTTALDP